MGPQLQSAQQSKESLSRLYSDPRNFFSYTCMAHSDGMWGLRFFGHEAIFAVSTIKDSNSAPFIYQFPNYGFSFERKGSDVELRTNLVLESFKARAISCFRSLGPLDAEIFIHNMRPEQLRPKLDGICWDDWRLKGSKEYRQNQARENTRVLLAQVEKHKSLNQFKKILVLGCGDGCDIEALIKYGSEKIKEATILGVDQSGVALEEAKIRNAKAFSDSKLKFKNLLFNDISKLISDGPFDLVLAVGVFDRETLIFDDAVRLAGMLRILLTADGILASTAYGYNVLEKENFEDLGYNPLQTINPEMLFSIANPSIYIMQNSLVAIKSTTDNAAIRSAKIWGNKF